NRAPSYRSSVLPDVLPATAASDAVTPHPGGGLSMKRSFMLVGLACCLAVCAAGAARAGAPQPDQREGDFAHVCQGGPNKAQPCIPATQSADCPKSECVVRALSRPIAATLTLIAHDSVTDWRQGSATNSALTVMLEVQDPDGNPQILAATYQDLSAPTNPPEAPINVVAIPMDETALQNLSSAVNGLVFAQPESTLGQQLQQLFNVTGTPLIVAPPDRPVALAHHTAAAFPPV